MSEPRMIARLIQIPGRYWAVTVAGWLQHIAGDEWILLPGALVIRRTGERRGLDWIAAHGPVRDYAASDPTVTPEPIHRLIVKRSKIMLLEADGWKQLRRRPAPLTPEQIDAMGVW